MGLDFDTLYPGRFMKAGHLGGRDMTLVIKSIDVKELGSEDDEKESKVIVTFHKVARQLVLNKTNALCLKAMWGRDVGAWINKRVTVYPAPNPDSKRGFGDEICIRVRGSPDISAPMTFDIKPGRRKYTVTMQVTQLRAAAAQPKPTSVTSDGPPPDNVPLPTESGESEVLA